MNLTLKNAKRSKKKWRISKKIPRQNPKLTSTEAEVLFAIWKNDSPITYEDIAEHYRELFGNKKAKKVSTVRGAVNDIKRLESATGRKYVYESGGRAKTYAIDSQFVERQQTAVILLELDKGYKHLCQDRRPEWDRPRDEFEQYVSEKYEWDRNFVAGRIEDGRKSDYLRFEQFEDGKVVIIAEDRLDDDSEYLKLIVEDYGLELERNGLTSPDVTKLRELRALYGPFTLRQKDDEASPASLRAARP